MRISSTQDSHCDRRPLLFHLSAAADVQRLAVGPAVAAAAARAGWLYEAYTDDVRRGRHFGGGAPSSQPHGWPNGSLVVGGGHVEHVLWLTRTFDVIAVGDPFALLWPILHTAGAEELACSSDPAEIYAAVLDRLGQPVPEEALVIDGRPQGPCGVVIAPFLYPAFLDGPARLGIEVSARADQIEALRELGVKRLCGRWLDPERRAAFAGMLDENEGTVGRGDYAQLTLSIAKPHAAWGRGFLLGDPDFVSTQVARGQQRRLLPLYSQPQTVVIDAAAELLVKVGGTVFGRQYDDHDFFALAPLGHGLQLIDPGPPFEAMRGRARAVPPYDRQPQDDVDDTQLEAWADEGRVLSTLLFWSGMVRELDCVPRVMDLVTTTGLKAGLVMTAESILQQPRPPVSLLGAPRNRGGVLGLLELILGSAGEAAAPEALLPPGVLAQSLVAARKSVSEVLPPGGMPRGWWPILDAPLQPAGAGLVRLENGRPLFRVPHMSRPSYSQNVDDLRGTGTGPDPIASLRARVGRAASRVGADRYLEGARPFDWQRPGPFQDSIAEAVATAGFDYMWTKTLFGSPQLAHRRGDFAAVPLTAGVWGGWTPFFTVERTGDLRRAERRLCRRDRAGWLAATIDAPLWLGSGEVHEHGAAIYALADWLVRGGSSGRLVNVVPEVVARYARLLDDRAARGSIGSGSR